MHELIIRSVSNLISLIASFECIVIVDSFSLLNKHRMNKSPCKTRNLIFYSVSRISIHLIMLNMYKHLKQLSVVSNDFKLIFNVEYGVVGN